MNYAFYTIFIIILLVIYLNYRYTKKRENNAYAARYLKEIREELEKFENRTLEGLNALEIKIDNLEKNDGLKESIKKSLEEIKKIEKNRKNKQEKNFREIFKEYSEIKAQNTEERNNLYRKIKAMKQEGKNIIEIADKLDMGIRELELFWKIKSREVS